MILVDYSSTIHRMIHTSVASMKPAKEDGKFITSEFSSFMKYLIFQDLFSIQQEYSQKFGELIICLDKSSRGYWRTDFFPGYKSQRKAGRDESEVDYHEVFKEVNTLTDQLRRNLPWKVLEVDKAEADDIMLVLAKEYCNQEMILIHSPDKDMIQAQRGTKNVHQWSSLTKKWLIPETKHENMDHWLMEHVVLGDAGDGVPKIVDGTEFSTVFLDYLKKFGYNISDPAEFELASLALDEKKIIADFDVFKLNRKKESTGIKDIYKDMRFGSAALKKKIKEHSTLDKWLDSHPMYRRHYDRNFKLVMSEGIPVNIWTEILINYKDAVHDYNDREFEEYLKSNDLAQMIIDLPSVFKIQRELCADDFNW